MLNTITDLTDIRANVDAAFDIHQIRISDGLRNFLHACAGLSLTEITEQAKQNIAACDAFVADFVREIHNFFACIILGAVSSSACKWAMENIVACAANIPALSTATTVVC